MDEKRMGYWRGRPLEDLTREELMAAIIELNRFWFDRHETLADDLSRTRDVEEMR
jgi:hypothetical protein